MRSAGIVLIAIGMAIAYLGWNGKLGEAWSALVTGKTPASGPNPAPEPKSTQVTQSVFQRPTSTVQNPTIDYVPPPKGP